MPNHDAERALLGCLLVDGDAVWKVLELITIDNLSFDAHRRLFNTIVDAVKAGKPSDLLVITDMLEKNGDLEKVGGAVFLAELLDGSHSAANVTHYAELVRIESVRDRSKHEASAFYHRMGESVDPEKTIFEHQKTIASIVGDGESDADASMTVAVPDAMIYIENLQKKELPGLSYGREFPRWNSFTGGSQPELTVLAAMSSLGKTSLLDQWFENFELQGVKCIEFSLEMSAGRLARRRIYRRIGKVIPNFHERMIAKNEIDPSILARAASEVSQSTVMVYTFSSIDKIIAKIYSKALSNACGAFGVDYLQMVTGGKGRTRNEEVGSNIRILKKAVQDLNIPGYVLSQFSRAPQKENREPILADLRDSGEIEQAADNVEFIHRKRNKETGRLESEGDLIRAKGRDNDCGRVRVYFHGPSLTFKEIDDRQSDIYSNGVEPGCGHRDFREPNGG